MENLTGLPHSHTPPHTPFFPPTFSLSERKIFFLFLSQSLLGGHILSIGFSLFSPVIIACPSAGCKPFGQAIFTGSYRPRNDLSRAVFPAYKSDAPAADLSPYRRGEEAASAGDAPAYPVHGRFPPATGLKSCVLPPAPPSVLAFSAVPTYFKSNLLYNNQRKKSQKQCEKNILVLQVKRESSLSY